MTERPDQAERWWLYRRKAWSGPEQIRPAGPWNTGRSIDPICESIEVIPASKLDALQAELDEERGSHKFWQDQAEGRNNRAEELFADLTAAREALAELADFQHDEMDTWRYTVGEMRKLARAALTKGGAKDGQHYYVMVAGNGEVIVTSEMYTRAEDAERGAKAFAKAATADGTVARREGGDDG